MSKDEEIQRPATALSGHQFEAESRGPLSRGYQTSSRTGNSSNESRLKKQNDSYQFACVDANEPLLDGFILLRLAQLLNSDVYYIGLQRQQTPRRRLLRSKQRLAEDFNRPGCSAADRGDQLDAELANGVEHTETPSLTSKARLATDFEANDRSKNNSEREREDRPRDGAEEYGAEQVGHRKNLLDELAQINPWQGFIERVPWLASLTRLICIGLSLVAIMISVDKAISTILLCLISRPDIKARPGNIGLAYETSDISMSWLVLILLNISSMYILFSTVFNGHLVWQLLSQRLFLVSRTFQYKTMLSMFVFIYLEYIINISFVNNLFGWSFETNDNDVASDGPGSARWHKGANLAPTSPSGRDSAVNLQGNIVNSYSVLSNVKTFVTEKDEANLPLDVLLTIFQFARGIIRISPYITINYVTICLKEHIKTIRNQNLLTESLKRKQKLRLEAKSKRVVTSGQSTAFNNGLQNGSRLTVPPTSQTNNVEAARKKRVIFVTDASATCQVPQTLSLELETTTNSARDRPNETFGTSPLSFSTDHSHTPSPISIDRQSGSVSSVTMPTPDNSDGRSTVRKMRPPPQTEFLPPISQSTGGSRRNYLNRIRDFNELEAYVTNLYIFTGRLNRLMLRQGLALYFIVHNLVITTTLIVPEAISGGSLMVQLVRVLVVLIGIVPFVAGQALDGQLEQLSKQIDRIIIKQQFISRKRDNLVRIRELLHDIRVNCGGMLDFNIETGIKYLVVAFATAFFIEQEDYKLTRRH